jgi:transposase
MAAMAITRDEHDAARAAGMDRQTLRDWLYRYNAEGLAGLSARPHGGGPARLLTAERRRRWPSASA